MIEISKRKQGAVVVIDFNLLEDWDSFERIAQLLQDYFGASVTERIDGPESRVWTMVIDDNKMTLHNNPYGNFLKSEGLNATKTMDLIYAQWSTYSKL